MNEPASKPPTLRQSLFAKWRRVTGSALIYGWIGNGIRLGGNIVILPLIKNKLDTSEDALWWVFVAVGALCNIADFGLGNVISRVYSYLWAGAADFSAEGIDEHKQMGEPNRAKLRQLNASLSYLYVRLSLVATAVLAVGGTWFIYHSVQQAARPGLIWCAWFSYVIALGYGIATSYWPLACAGINAVRQSQSAVMWGGIVYLICAAGLLLAGWGLLAMVVAVTVRSVVQRELCRRSFQQEVSPGDDSAAEPDISMIKRLWPNARKFGMLAIGGFLITNANTFICYQFLGKEITALYGPTQNIGAFLMNISGLWLSVKWPQIAMLRVQGRTHEMSVVFARRLLMVLVTFAMGAVFVVCFGDQLLQWKGSEKKLLGTAFLTVYFAYLFHQVIYVQFGMLVFTENVVPFFRIGLATGVAVVLLSLVLTPRFGLWGLILAAPLAEMAYSGWYTVRRGFQGQPLKWSELMRAALFGHV